MKKTTIYVLGMLAALLLLAGCNAQKHNTAATRRYTAFITKYNIYYNGDKHFKETLEEMERKYEDDYSRLVYMHPVEAKSDEKAPQPAGDFKRSIEKAQKAIQIRSIKKKPAKKAGKANNPEYKEWMKRDEYNPVLHNSWMLMGRSQYYNGDFLGAASTFYYISKHFTWLPSTVTAAKIWQAASYVALDWLYEAEAIITRIKPEELTDKKLKTLYDFTYADYLIRSKEYKKAVPYLQGAIDGSGGAQKTRLRFLLGQVYAEIGEKQLAYEAFKKAGSSSSASYRTKFNARIKQSEVYTGDNIEPEVKSLRRMLRYDRNKEYLDQIYYAIGNLYLSRGDTTQAIANYEQAVAKSTRSGIDKALAQTTLGGLYFARQNYEKAQPCYSQAIPLLPETFPDYQLLKRRSDVLDELAVYSQNVNLQDSLLHLASLPEKEQLAVIDKIIEDLKKKEKEEAQEAMRQEILANQSVGSNSLVDKNQREFNISGDDSWYFYNQASKASGKTEFQKRWGARKLEDDWRRRNKTTFNTADFDSADNDGDDGERADAPADSTATDQAATAAENDPHKREYYLKQIPKTDADKATANEVIQDGLYNMGVILKDKLEDYPSARTEFARLQTDYPDNVYRLDVYYNQYLMCMHDGDKAGAEKYRRLILGEFPDSKYGVALNDPDYIEKLRNMDERQRELYEQTYEDYLANRNSKVHEASRIIQEEYPLSKIIPKFMFLDALAYVTEKKPDEFNAVLRDMLDRYPSTDLAPVASAWLKGMAQGRELKSSNDGANMRGMLWDIHLTNDSTYNASDSIPAFELNENSPQMLVLVFPADRVNGNVLLYEVARHNFNSFVVKDFDLELMNFGRLGMLTIRGFENQKELNHYRKVMASGDFRLPAGVDPIAISEKNFNLLLDQGRTFDDYFRFLQKHNYEDPQAGLLKAEDIETLEEAEENEDAGDMSLPVAVPDDEDDDEQADSSDDVVIDLSPAILEQEKTEPVKSEPAKTEPAKSEPVKTEPAKSEPEKTEPVKPKPEPKKKKVEDPDLPTGSEGDDDPLLK